MNKTAWAWVAACVLIVAGCQQPTPPAGAPAQTAATRPAPATMPAGAKVPLAKLQPSPKPLSDAPDANNVSERAADIVAQAEAELAKRDFFKAVQLFDRARGFDPKSARILRGLGLAHAGAGDRAKAEPPLRQSLDTAPDHVRVHLLLADYDLIANKADEAVLRLRSALLCSDAKPENPDAAEAMFKLANILTRQGYFTAAYELYDQLERQINDHGREYADRELLKPLVTQPERFMVLRGGLLLRLERNAEAAELLDKAYRRDKTNPEAGRLAVKAFLAAKEYPKATALILEMMQEPSQKMLAVDLAVEVCKARKDPTLPRKLVESGQSKTKLDSAFVIAMAEQAAELNSPAEAADILAKYMAASPTDAVAGLRLAVLYEKTGNFVQAARQLAALQDSGAQAGAVTSGVNRLARRAKPAVAADLAASAAKEQGRMAPAVLTVAGMLAGAAGDSANAEKYLRQAIAKDAKYWPAYEAMQSVFNLSGQTQALEDINKQILQQAAEDAIGYYLVGRAQLERGQPQEAIANLERAKARRADHVPTLLTLSRAYVQTMNHPAAEKCVQSALTLDPDNLDVLQHYYDLCVITRRNREAGQLAERAVQLQPRSVQARVMAGRFFLLAHQYDRARQTLEQLKADAPDDVEVLMLDVRMDLPESLGDLPLPPDQAKNVLAKLDKVLKADPNNLLAEGMRASVLTNQSRFKEAAEAWGQLVRRRPYDFELTNGYLDCLTKSNNDAEAAKALDAIIADPQRMAGPSIRLLVIDNLQKLKRFDQGEKLLEKWLTEIKPTDDRELAIFRLRAIRLYEVAKHFDKAQALVDDWINHATEEQVIASLRREKMRLFGQAGQFDEAVAYCKKWQGNEPNSAEPRNALVGALVEAKQYDKALAAVDEWMPQADAKLRVQLQANKLIILGKQEKFDAVVEAARKWAADSPSADEPFGIGIAVLSDAKKFDLAHKLALEWLGKADTDDRRTDARLAVVRTLLAGDHLEQALEKARDFAKAEPKNPRILRLLAAALKLNDKDEEATPILVKVFELDPDDEGTNNDLGYTWADQGINLAQAETMVRKACASRPNEPAFLDSLGWVFYKLARFADAKNVFDQVFQAKDEKLDSVIFDHAADNAWRLGDKNRAIQLWQQAIDVGKKEEKPSRDVKKVLADAPAKIEAARKGTAPKVAPLGQGVAEPVNK